VLTEARPACRSRHTITMMQRGVVIVAMAASLVLSAASAADLCEYSPDNN